MVFWSLIWIGFLGVLVWTAIQWARGGAHDPDAAARPAKTARQLLDERLAAGEIDIDEYQRRRAALEQSNRAGAAS